MISTELREKFLEFFKKQGHVIVPSSSLIPDDASVLFTTAGMQQFVSYLSGETAPSYSRACSVQKCFRVNDIDRVGDANHHTFFEMLGNWSFGDYFKEEAINFALKFLTKELRLDKNRLWFTVFNGEINIPKDKEAAGLWQEAGIDEKRIFYFGMSDNFWGPTGQIGPCGPSSEIHYDLTGESCSLDEKCRPNCLCGRFVEIWNLVFMEYFKNDKGKYLPLARKNIDTGIGFERLLSILQNKKSAYETDLFDWLMEAINKIIPESDEKEIKCRVMSDHLRASCFLIADGVLPSNIEQGYVLRRLLRRIIGQGKIYNLIGNFLIPLARNIIDYYGDIYPELKNRENDILTVIEQEEEKFSKTIINGIKEFNKITKNISKKIISAEEAFILFSTYGLPLDMLKDLARQKNIAVDEKGFNECRQRHQELSRAGAEKKFGGHGLGETRIFNSTDEEKAKKLHTATHLLHQALYEVLGAEIRQMGSDINPERLRFDFSFDRKLSLEELKKIEDLINLKIKENLAIICREMGKEEAIASGAKAFFKKKYGDKVKVYSISDYSKEICAGPHVNFTGELGHFKITKEESAGAGIRRIRAVLE